MNTKERRNYLEDGFIIPIEKNNVSGYASINKEMICAGSEMAPTGHYFVYLLHPQRGSLHFTIEQEIAAGQWFVRDHVVDIETDILLEIGIAIYKEEQRILDKAS